MQAIGRPVSDRLGPTTQLLLDVKLGSDAGSKLEKARQLGVETLDEDAFLKLIIEN